MVAAIIFAAAFALGRRSLLAIRFLQGDRLLRRGGGGQRADQRGHPPGTAEAGGVSLQSSYAVGYAVSVSLFPVITALVPKALGWRVFFGIGTGR